AGLPCVLLPRLRLYARLRTSSASRSEILAQSEQAFPVGCRALLARGDAHADGAAQIGEIRIDDAIEDLATLATPPDHASAIKEVKVTRGIRLGQARTRDDVVHRALAVAQAVHDLQ